MARGGIVFAPGRAGTVQEIFQATTMTFYGTVSTSGPFVFLGRRFWTDELPVESLLGPLLANSPRGDLRHLIHITDDPHEAAELIAG
jgi:predicted Rossmann-fold nucleotide-binding protein